MLRADAEKQVRAVERTCRGLNLLREDYRREMFAKLEKVAHSTITCTLSGDWRTPYHELRQTVLEALFTPEGATRHGAPRQYETIGEAWSDVAVLLDMRAGCGADFNDIICAHPFDGQQREYRCPRCGQTGPFTSPYFELTEQ